ncbi:MAG TPA: MarR family transcriptional regulator [Candidatus Atopostipes pullistercoris]|uniref:MarR family transcriptional regulator n=1 Tax=Candidatus Atopostipes pullistercoris TaxID=2838467 RepID=A0A9D2G344_9LACT|nr:MarR family transcriptional regulator [Candidatus Atopostipes pullistercoris]
MTPELSEEYIFACMRAKRTTQFLPDPPSGLRKRHIYIIKVCYDLSLELDEVRVSDVAERINVTLPSVTRNITTLEEKGYLKKEENSEDKRVVNILLTDKGLALFEKDIYDFHKKNSELLKDVPEEDVRVTIKTIHRIYHLLEKEYVKS